MDKQLREWKFSVERLWSAAAPDYYEAARLAADIASASEEAILRQAATQALPILRSASSEDADQSTRDAARRRRRRNVIGNYWDCRSAVACPVSKSTGPINVSPRARTRTPAAARTNFRNSPRREMRS
jgi:hypothetical protein